MGSRDWYRRTTWSETDQAEFFARLNRSRSAFHKAQYLRIQALHLQEAGTPELIRAALTLLDKVENDYPDSFDQASVYLQKATCRLALGNKTGAVDYFRKALQWQKVHTFVQTTASLAFAWMIVEHGLADLYDEALSVLDDYVESGHPVFAYQWYMLSAVRAVIAEERGYRDRARELARAALGFAALKQSGFRYHPKVGLVQITDSPVHARLVQIIGN